jgi:hypothetical protein
VAFTIAAIRRNSMGVEGKTADAGPGRRIQARPRWASVRPR